MPPFYVYSLRNKENGKEYIGQCDARGIEERFREHRKSRPNKIKEDAPNVAAFDRLFSIQLLHGPLSTEELLITTRQWRFRRGAQPCRG